MDDSKTLLLTALRAMLRPIMRFCVRYCLHIQDVLEAAKVSLIEVAEEELQKGGREPNVCRLCATTGMHRRDVMRIHRRERMVEEPQGMINRIIGQWQYDKRFTTKNGKPRVLTVDGPESEFKQLVAAVSRFPKAGTVLFELERLGAIERTREGVRLITRSYLPAGQLKAGLEFMRKDVDYLLSCISDNIFTGRQPPHLHATTEFTNIDRSFMHQIRQWLLDEGAAFHQRLREYLSKFDRDVNPSCRTNKGGGVVAVGTFGFSSEE